MLGRSHTDREAAEAQQLLRWLDDVKARLEEKPNA